MVWGSSILLENKAARAAEDGDLEGGPVEGVVGYEKGHLCDAHWSVAGSVHISERKKLDAR